MINKLRSIGLSGVGHRERKWIACRSPAWLERSIARSRMLELLASMESIFVDEGGVAHFPVMPQPSGSVCLF